MQNDNKSRLDNKSLPLKNKSKHNGDIDLMGTQDILGELGKGIGIKKKHTIVDNKIK